MDKKKCFYTNSLLSNFSKRLQVNEISPHLLIMSSLPKLYLQFENCPLPRQKYIHDTKSIRAVGIQFNDSSGLIWGVTITHNDKIIWIWEFVIYRLDKMANYKVVGILPNIYK